MAQFTISSRYGTTTFESNHTDQHQLYNRLKTLVSKQEIVNTHATRLVHGFQRFGSWKDYHEAWAAWHVAKHDHPERFSKQEIAHVTGMHTILDHLKSATGSLKRPVVTLEVEDQTVVLKLNTSGRRPGTIAVSESTRFGEGAFYGYIDGDSFEPRGTCTSTTVVEILQRVATNPPLVISEIGRQSGKCCYCPAALTQAQSKIAGCGKTFASNYSVDYPNAARTREVLDENPEFLVGATDADRWS